jgi:hypothetical protein
MATIYHSFSPPELSWKDEYEATTPAITPGVRTCSFCQLEAAEGYWLTQAGRFSLCERCAREDMAKLIGDVLVGQGLMNGNLRPVQKFLDVFQINLWKAVAVAVGRTDADKNATMAAERKKQEVARSPLEKLRKLHEPQADNGTAVKKG